MSLFAVLHSLMRLASGVTHLDLNPLLFHNSFCLSVYSPWGACFPSSSALDCLSIFPPASSASPGVTLLALSSLYLLSFLTGFLSLYYTLSHFLHFSHFKPSLLPHLRQPSVATFFPPLPYLSVFKLFPLRAILTFSLVAV